MEFYHCHDGGRLLFDLLDAHARGELCRHNGGGRLLVDS